MDSLNLQFLGSLIGRVRLANGTSRTLNGRTFNGALNQTTVTSGTAITTGSTFANNGFDTTATLATTATTVYDLRSFTNALGEPTQAISKLRLFYIQHGVTSPASSISVGNSGANGLIIQGCCGTTPVQLAPGGILLLSLPALAAAVTVNSTAKDVRVANNGTTAAAYTLGWWGEV